MPIEMQTNRTTSASFHATPLAPSYRAKPWGRRDGLPAPAEAQPLGELVFDAAATGLVVKWLQTSAPLSVQAHPRGAGRKHEWWYVAEARPGAYLHLGLTAPAGAEEIARAARDGSLPGMLRRIVPAPGDTFFIESGTIHALGPGLTVVEVQEPSDVTYRLYDYGRPRELHLDRALAEAILEPRPVLPMPGPGAPFRIALERLAPGGRRMLQAARACIAVAEGSGSLGERPYRPQQCWEVAGALPLRASAPSLLIVAEPGGNDNGRAGE